MILGTNITEAVQNNGIVILIFICGLLILVAMFFIANRRTLFKNSKNYINNSAKPEYNEVHPNIVDATYEIPEEKEEIIPEQKQEHIYEKLTEQEFLTNLYRKKFNGEITEAEFNAAMSRYRNTKDDYDD